MSSLLIVSIVIRLGVIVWAMAWSLVLLRRLKDWRMGFLTVVLSLMTLREGLTLLGNRDLGIISVISGAAEQPGIVLSIALFIAIPFLARMLTEWKRAEYALRQSESTFRVLAETAKSGIMISQGSRLVYLNPFAEALVGYSKEELLSMDASQLVHPDFREFVRERGEARRRGDRSPSRCELKINTKSGEEAWLDFAAAPMEFEGKTALLATAFDITERKRAEDELRKQKEILQRIFDRIPVMIAFIGEGDRIKLVNPEWERTLGWSLNEVEGNNLDILAETYPDPKYRQTVLDFIAESSGEWADFKTRVRDGRVIDTSWANIHLSDGTSIGIGQDITERKRAEDALRASEERYRDLVENARDIIYSHDLKGNYTSVNRAVERITGYAREEALKLNFEQAVAPECVETARQMIAAKLAGQKETVYDLEIIGKDGRRITVEVNTRLVLQDDVPIGIQGIARDVTERKQAEQALRESRAHLHAILDNCPAMIFDKDLDGRYRQINRQFERTFNLTPEKVLGRTDAEVFPPELAAAFRATDCAVLEAGRSLEFEEHAVHADGLHTYIVHKFPLQDAAGNVYAVGGISTDITARQRAEDDLRKQKEILQKIFDHIPVMIRFLNEEGRLKLVNREWERILGWSQEEVDNRGLDIFRELYPDPEYRQYVMSFIAASTGEFTDLKTRAKDGRVIDTTFANIRLEDGTNIGIGRDISERTRAADLLRRQTAQLAALHEIELEISAESDLSRILEVVTRRAAELLDASHCSTFIRDRDEAALTLVASLEGRFVGLRLEEGEGLAGRALATGDAQAVDDYSVWQGRAHHFDAEGFGPAMAAPLKWQQTVIGAIMLSRKRGEEPFTGEASRLLEQLAAEAAIAIHQATLFDEVQESQRRLQILSRRLIDAQEAERKRLSRELHDQIGQALTAVQISLQALQSSLGGTCGPLHDCLTIIDDALEQVHDLSLDLRPSLLDDLGLVAALRWYVDRVASRAGLVRSFNADVLETRLAPQVETACFRIAQEALTNVLRHAQAASVWVQVTQRDSGLQLVVQDDGVGFDVRAAMSRTGANASLGLQGMQERAAALGGIVDIQSQPGNGVEVLASFPLTQAHSV